MIVPPTIRAVLLQRHMDMSMRNGRMSLVSFGILVFGLAFEAPLLPRISAWAALALVFGVRVVRARRMLRRLGRADSPRLSSGIVGARTAAQRRQNGRAAADVVNHHAAKGTGP